MPAGGCCGHAAGALRHAGPALAACDLEHVSGLPEAVDAVFSCGPLDLFARWYADSTLRCTRVVAFGSTSAASKHGSEDDHERDVARRLLVAEASLFEVSEQRGASATMLRPTLVYGAGRDQTLTRIAQLAQRWGRFVLPRRADGLRQPVHVHDLATAALSASQPMKRMAAATTCPAARPFRIARWCGGLLRVCTPSGLSNCHALFRTALTGAGTRHRRRPHACGSPAHARGPGVRHRASQARFRLRTARIPAPGADVRAHLGRGVRPGWQACALSPACARR